MLCLIYVESSNPLKSIQVISKKTDPRSLEYIKIHQFFFSASVNVFSLLQP